MQELAFCQQQQQKCIGNKTTVNMFSTAYVQKEI